MANQWITFIKQWANSHQMSYGCALSDPEMKAEYHKRFPKKLTKKAVKAMSQLEESKPEGNVKTKATFPNLKIKIPDPDENMQLMVTEIEPAVPRPKKVKSKKLKIVPEFDIVEEPTKQIPKMEVYRRGDREGGFVPKFIKLDLTDEEIKVIKKYRKNSKVSFYKPPLITEAYDEFMKRKNDKGEVPSWISVKRKGRANDEYFIINNRAMVWGDHMPYGRSNQDTHFKYIEYTPDEMNEKYFIYFNHFNNNLKKMAEQYSPSKPEEKRKVKGGMIPNNEKTDKQLRGELMHMAKNFKNLEEMEGSAEDKESDFHKWGFNALDALSNLSKSYASERAIQDLGTLYGSFHPVFRNAIKDLASHYVENDIPFM